MSHGVRQDIVALTELDHIGSVRARLLAGAGLRTPEAIAAADVAAIETAIAKGAQSPFLCTVLPPWTSLLLKPRSRRVHPFCICIAAADVVRSLLSCAPYHVSMPSQTALSGQCNAKMRIALTLAA